MIFSSIFAISVSATPAFSPHHIKLKTYFFKKKKKRKEKENKGLATTPLGEGGGRRGGWHHL